MATTTSQINEIKEDLSDAYTALGAKGATLPAANARGSANLASTIATVPSPDPVNKAFTVTNGVLSVPKNITFSENTFADVTSIDNQGLQYKYSYTSNNVSNPGGVVKFDNVTSIRNDGLNNAFQCCNITSVSFNSLTQIDSYRAMTGAFYDNTSLTTISFPALTSISGISSFYMCFKYAPLTSVSFPNLETVNGDSCMRECFSSCTSLTSVSFPKLKTISGGYTLGAFYGCTSLSSVDFSALESIDSSSLRTCFYGCTALTTISFPSLTTVTQYSFMEAFTNCTNLTAIHFPAAIQSAIEATSGYDSKWGATNATIYFDL